MRLFWHQKGTNLKTNRKFTRCLTVLASLALAATLSSAQKPLFDEAPSRTLIKQAPVEFLYPEQIHLPVGKSTLVTLHFRIAPGLHINSHDPKDEFLIPTVFSIPEGFGVHLESASYPAGVEFSLPAEPKSKLIVYSGDFSLQVKLTAVAGDHLIEGKLHYQACDNSACMPPRTIPVAIDVVAR